MIREADTPNSARGRRMVELERNFWQSDREWRQQQTHLAARLLMLQVDGPGDYLQRDTAKAIEQIDRQCSQLCPSQFAELQSCYQTGLYLWHYLNAISYNTEAAEVR